MPKLHQDIVLFFSLIKEGNIDQIIELIRAGYDVNARFEEGVTPAIHATCYERLEILEVLVKAGADVNLVDQSMASPLMIAELQGYQDIVDYLYPLTSQEIRDMVRDTLEELSE